MGRFWKALKITFGAIVGLLFLMAAASAVTWEWAMISVGMFLMMFVFVMWEMCE
jgi:multisubunit Na+/H+ antiporter MnhE subunit